MDDGIELNFATSVSSGPVRAAAAAPKKGGRWTDRARARKEIRRSLTTVPQVPKMAGVASAGIQQSAAIAAKPPPRISAERPAPSLSAPAPATASAPSQAASSSRAVAQTINQARVPRQAVPYRSTSNDLPTSPGAGPSRLPVARPQHPISSKPKSTAPQIISSLFTSNPQTKTKVAPTETAPAHVAQPSNAPSDTSTFEGLGLDPLLVRHLKGKMSIDRPTGIQRSALPHLLSTPLNIDTAAAGESGDADDYEQATSLPTSTPRIRDAFIQSQTGSGKTLTYLLPIVQALLPLSRLSYIDRSIGTLAIILAPTRELAQQISKVLEQILTLSLAPIDEGDEEAQHYTRWLVSGLLTGGSTKTHEKARLRKGVPILVSTPGRLLDHLQNTSSFQCGKVLFLVLDEADRLMDLGFEDTVKAIVRGLDGRRRIEIAGEAEKEREEEGGFMRWPYWNRGRQTVLCSATVDAKVERLAGEALHEPIVFRSTELSTSEQPAKRIDKSIQDAVLAATDQANPVILPGESDKFTPPSQLSQRYIVVPTKLRLVTLVALIRQLTSGKSRLGLETGAKIIVFFSSTDAVDFMWKLLGNMRMGEDPAPAEEEGEDEHHAVESGAEDEDVEATKAVKKAPKAEIVSLTSPLFGSTTLHRLHGSLPLKTRLASLSSFSAPTPDPSVLFATSVASRGLDLPLVRAVVQYDLPTEGGANEYVHRVGRTARAGKGGEAWAFVAPSEEEWVPWVVGKMGRAEGKGINLARTEVEDVLKKGFGGKGYEYEQRATDVQLGCEHWVLADEQNATLARKAFSSFVRAYSTHPADEKKFFHPRSLHLGHLAKSFALREAPGALSASTKASKTSKTTDTGNKRKRANDSDDELPQPKAERGGKETTARNATELRMYEAVRKQGKASKSGGTMGDMGAGKSGNSEYQILDSKNLERMAGGRR